jgi:hypothetical protein
MEKLSNIPHSFIVVESSINRDVMKLGVPQQKYGMPGSKIIRDLLEIQLDFGVVPIFAGDSGVKVVRDIFELIVKRYPNEAKLDV